MKNLKKSYTKSPRLRKKQRGQWSCLNCGKRDNHPAGRNCSNCGRPRDKFL